MPAIRFERYESTTRAVVWRGTESREELLEALPLQWHNNIPALPARAIETLSARRSLLALAPEAGKEGFVKDEFGKPHFAHNNSLHFSLSHSHKHAAALVSEAPCGIDLQIRVEKIIRLRGKFESTAEREFIQQQPSEVDALHVLFGAKEALFKLWGKREIDWHKNLIVKPFLLTPGGGSFKGEVRKNDELIKANLYWRWIDDFCLVVAVLDQEGSFTS